MGKTWSTGDILHDILETWADSRAAKKLRVGKRFRVEPLGLVDGAGMWSVPSLGPISLKIACIGLK